MPEKENFAEQTFTFKLSIWKILFRWFIFLLLAFLNFALVASTVSQNLEGRPQELPIVVCTYLVVFFFNLTILLPLLFEADTVWVLPDKLVLKTLLWRTKVPYGEIVDVRLPMWSKFLILRKKHVIYLLHRKDLQPFDMLVEKIVEKTGQEKFFG